MKLDKENTKQILKIVVIAIILLVALFNIKTVWNACISFLDIISPFIWGLAIAFILNIFMSVYENKVFKLGTKKKTKTSKKMQNTEAINLKPSNNAKRLSQKKSGIERIFSIALSIITVIAIIAIILLLIVPQFIDVIRNLISNIPNYLESLQELGIKITEQFPEANSFIQNIEIDTEALRNGIVNLSKNVLDITINQISSLISNIVNAFISIIFAVYILANKEELKNQAKKFIYARIDEEKADSIIYQIIKTTNSNGMTTLLYVAWYVMSELHLRQNKYEVAFGIVNNSLIQLEKNNTTSEYLLMLFKYNMYKIMMFKQQYEKADICIAHAKYIAQKYNINFKFDTDKNHYIAIEDDEVSLEDAESILGVSAPVNEQNSESGEV